MPLPKLLKDVLSLPTAPFCESAVQAYVAAACRCIPGVTLTTDRYGNLLAHYQHQPPDRTPLAFVAHLDHPGFVALEMTDRKTLRAAFRGGVRPEYFPRARVRFWHGKRALKGTITKVTRVEPPATKGGIARPEEVLLRVAANVPPGTPGMWDLPDPALRGDRVTARACDDLAGVAAMIDLLTRLGRQRVPGEVFCLFTRGEEVGFAGALAAARDGVLPHHAAVLSVETSSTLPHAPLGAGPIVRVGDRVSVFAPALTAFLVRVAQRRAERHRSFRFQRKLMDGGACEANAFLVHGYAATGICLALGNYHNMDTARRRIASEYISLKDWQMMVDLFEALVRNEHGPGAEDSSLIQRLDKLLDKYEPLLLAHRAAASHA